SESDSDSDSDSESDSRVERQRSAEASPALNWSTLLAMVEAATKRCDDLVGDIERSCAFLPRHEAHCNRDVERRSAFARGAHRGLEALAPVSAAATVAFGDVE